MPESNGKSNFTAILNRADAVGLDVFNGFTIARSEYPDRVRYDADCVRHLIGELPESPNLWDYDGDKHSGYVEPATPAQATPEGGQDLRSGAEAAFHVLAPDHIESWIDLNSAQRERYECVARAVLTASQQSIESMLWDDSEPCTCLPPLPEPDCNKGYALGSDEEFWSADQMRDYARAALAAQQNSASNSSNTSASQQAAEPVAWLKEWDSVGGARTGMRRVDLTPDCELWLANMFPTITPLYRAAPHQLVGKPNADCSGDPTSCPDNEGHGCACDPLNKAAGQCAVCAGSRVAFGKRCECVGDVR